MTEPHGLLGPAFAGDTGDADPQLLAGLTGLDGSAQARVRALRALAAARVFVPVSAAAVPEQTGAVPREDLHAEMAMVTVTGRDGRRAVPVFSSAGGLLAWHGELRPVPVEGARAARTAVDDGAAALLLNPGQPTQLVVTGSELNQLAEVWTEATARGGATA